MRAVSSVLLCCVAMVACARPVGREEPATPVHLADAVAAAADTVAPLVDVAGVKRPTFHTVERVVAQPGGPATRASGMRELRVACPPSLAGRTVLAGVDGSGRVETHRCPAEDGEPLRLRVPGEAWDATPAAVGLQDVAVAAGPVRLPPGARLRAGLGMQRGVRACRPGAAATFRVVARNAAGRTAVVLQRRLEPGLRLEDGRWVDVEAALDPAREALGSPVTLHFEVTVEGEEADRPAWGDPTIVHAATDPPPVAPPRWNVVLVSLDTLRADRLGCYGAARPTSPVIDWLASQGTRFDTVIAPAPWTLPSHVSMLTGVYPCVHQRVGPLPGLPLPRGVRPLAERLRAAGYDTAAVTENNYFDVAALGRGFGSYTENVDGVVDRVRATVGTAVDWVRDRAREPFFLVVHTYEPHDPYWAPPPFEEMFRPEPADGPRRAPSKRDRLLDQYDRGIAFTDASLAPLFDAVEARGLRDRTMVILTSDHGEAFYEHGYTGHGKTLHDELLRVPLVWRAPGLAAEGRRVAGQVSLIDIVPTLLDLLGLPGAGETQGVSLAPYLRAEAPQAMPPGRLLFSENSRKSGNELDVLERLAVRSDTHKALLDAGTNVLFDLTRDPGERAGGASGPAVADLLRAADAFRLDCARRRAAVAGAGEPPADAEAAQPLDAELLRRLRDLGYAQ